MNSVGKKRKIKSVNMQIKVESVKKIQSGVSVTETAVKLDVPVSTVRGWVKNRDALFQWEMQHDITRNTRKRVREPVHSKVGEAVWLWFRERRAAGCPLTGTILRAQALRFWEQLDGSTPFTASQGWLHSWKKRYGVRCLSICGEKLSADKEASEIYKSKFLEIMNVEDLTPDQLFNCDETGLNFRQMPKTTLSSRCEEEGAAGFKLQKDRITVMACCNASGTFKLPLVVIGRSAKPRAIRKVMDKLPVSYENQQKAWMTMALFKKWFYDEFVPDVKAFLASRGLPQKAVLFMDNCAAHPKSLESEGIRVEFLPPNTTALLQPMDQGCLQNLKLLYRRQLMDFVLDKLNANKSLREALKDTTMKEVINWISNAWTNVSASTIIKSWKKVKILLQFFYFFIFSPT